MTTQEKFNLTQKFIAKLKSEGSFKEMIETKSFLGFLTQENIDFLMNTFKLFDYNTLKVRYVISNERGKSKRELPQAFEDEYKIAKQKYAEQGNFYPNSNEIIDCIRTGVTKTEKRWDYITIQNYLEEKS